MCVDLLLAPIKVCVLETKTVSLHSLILCVCVLVRERLRFCTNIYAFVCVGRGDRVLVLKNNMYVYVWEGETECLHSLILCVRDGEIYSLHQLILHICLERGQALIITVQYMCVWVRETDLLH